MHRFTLFSVIAAMLVAPSFAEDKDDLVRLPGQGEVKSERIAQVGAARLAPGGGLMASFDTDANGRISIQELETGIKAAFIAADANADGELTPLEQQDWAGNLPTRDESLLNPARFDPNLDRLVNEKEFSFVIRSIAEGYREDGSTEVVLATLKRDPRRETEESEDNSRPDPRDRARREQRRRRF